MTQINDLTRERIETLVYQGFEAHANLCEESGLPVTNTYWDDLHHPYYDLVRGAQAGVPQDTQVSPLEGAIEGSTGYDQFLRAVDAIPDLYNNHVEMKKLLVTHFKRFRPGGIQDLSKYRKRRLFGVFKGVEASAREIVESN